MTKKKVPNIFVLCLSHARPSLNRKTFIICAYNTFHKLPRVLSMFKPVVSTTVFRGISILLPPKSLSGFPKRLGPEEKGLQCLFFFKLVNCVKSPKVPTFAPAKVIPLSRASSEPCKYGMRRPEYLWDDLQNQPPPKRKEKITYWLVEVFVALNLEKWVLESWNKYSGIYQAFSQRKDRSSDWKKKNTLDSNPIMLDLFLWLYWFVKWNSGSKSSWRSQVFWSRAMTKQFLTPRAMFPQQVILWFQSSLRPLKLKISRCLHCLYVLGWIMYE